MSFLFKNRIVIKTAAFILTAASFIQIFFAFPFLSEENDIDISQIKSSSALITNLDTGTVLFSRNEEEQVFCGFLPQVIGCVLLLELSTDLNTEVTISKEVISQTPQISSANLKAGDVISLSDLITAVMMCGSQESCLAIAEYVSQDTDKFLELINNKVSELGCTGTKINNVHGYFKPYAVITTVNDIAKVLKYAVSVDGFLDYAKKTYTKIKVNGKERELYTRNSTIVSSSQYYVSKAQGVAVSTTSGYAAAANMTVDKNMRLLSVAVSSQGTSSVFSDMQIMLKFSAEEYVTKMLLKENETVGEIPVTLGKNRDHVVLTAENSITATIPKSVKDEEIKKITEIPESAEAPIEKGQVLGSIRYEYQGIVYGTSNLKAQAAVELDMIQYYTKKINDFFSSKIVWLILISIVAAVILYTFLMFRKNKKKAHRRKSENHERLKIDKNKSNKE